jgi:glycosyltransferase involved in cell wall biosynthesis
MRLRLKTMHIVFACGDTLADWNPETAKTMSGGSEVAVVELSARLAAKGHRVEVFTSCGWDGERDYDGVKYFFTDRLWSVAKCNALIVWRNADLFEVPLLTKTKLLWVHDLQPQNSTHRRLLRADRVVSVSAWHRKFLIEAERLHPEHVTWMRGGIPLERFHWSANIGAIRDPLKVVYASSPDRGLIPLLEMWPHVLAAVPQAELHVFYNYPGWKKRVVMQNDPYGVDVTIEIDRLLRRSPRVMVHGRLTQDELAREFMSAGVLAYPTDFNETLGAIMMEAKAAGLRIVTSRLAALCETVPPHGILISGDPKDDFYRQKFVQALVYALTAPETGCIDAMNREVSKDFAFKHYSWNGREDAWLDLIDECTENNKLGMMPPYRPFMERAR